MKESTTYQAILEEGRLEGLTTGRAEGKDEGQTMGRIEEAQNLLLRLGGKRFGAPNPSQEATIRAIASLGDLESLAERLLEAENWQELLTGRPNNLE